MNCNIQAVKRKRQSQFNYVFMPTLEEAIESEYTSFVYCYETKLLVSCGTGMHYQAIQEHLLDFLERNGLRAFGEPIPYPMDAEEFKFTEDEIRLMDDFIVTQLYLHGTDREYDIQRALY